MRKITFLVACLTSLATAQAQIPNPSFETWTNMGNYMTPSGWDNANAMTNSMSIYTCTQGSPGNPGSYYLKLISHTVGTMGVVPGVAVSGVMNSMTMMPKSGFPFTGQPVSLNGNMQYMAYGSGNGFIDVVLTKWNSSLNRRDTIAKGYKPLPAMQMSWTGFSVTLAYLSPNLPDSATIFLSSSGPTGAADNDYLYVDNLAFSGNAAGIEELMDNSLLMLYPNPSRDFLNVKLLNSAKAFTGYAIYSPEGVLIRSISGRMMPETSIDLSGLSQGVYLLKLISEDGVVCKRFVRE